MIVTFTSSIRFISWHFDLDERRCNLWFSPRIRLIGGWFDNATVWAIVQARLILKLLTDGSLCNCPNHQYQSVIPTNRVVKELSKGRGFLHVSPQWWLHDPFFLRFAILFMELVSASCAAWYHNSLRDISSNH
jgi:hypothetical protein